MPPFTYCTKPLLRPVIFTLTTRINNQKIEKSHRQGKFHIWGQRGDETGTDFFGVVEDEGGNCIELDPAQIIFQDV